MGQMGTLVDLDMYSGLCSQSFENKNIWPDIERVNLEYGATDMEAFNIILTNGDEDPWKWASLLENKNQMMAIEIECTNCAHCVDLYTPREDDAQTLKNARKVEIQEISRWIQEYNEKNGYNFRTTPKKEFSILDNPNTQEIQ